MNADEIQGRAPANVTTEVSYRQELMAWLQEIALQLARMNEGIRDALARGRRDALDGVTALPTSAESAGAGAREGATDAEPE